MGSIDKNILRVCDGGKQLRCARGAIDAETVYDHSGGRIVWMWRKYGPIVKEMRASYKISYICKWWEYLVGEMESVGKERSDNLELPEVWRTD